MVITNELSIYLLTYLLSCLYVTVHFASTVVYLRGAPTSRTWTGPQAFPSCFTDEKTAAQGVRALEPTRDCDRSLHVPVRSVSPPFTRASCLEVTMHTPTGENYATDLWSCRLHRPGPRVQAEAIQPGILRVAHGRAWPIAGQKVWGWH